VRGQAGNVITGAMDLLQNAVTSPWAYVLIFGVVLLDAFLPVIPGETAVITAGVFAATGDPNLIAVVAVAAGGGLAGDHVSYAIGRGSGGALVRWLRPGSRREAMYEWARRTLDARGAAVLVVARYLPGGRTATTLTMGAVGYPPRRFFGYDLVAATSWALYAAILGYVGGAAFEDEPVMGLVLGLGVAFALSVLLETARHVRKRRRATPVPYDERQLETAARC